MNQKYLSRSVSFALFALTAFSSNVIQAEELVINGDFSNGYTPWEVPGWWSDGDGTYEVDEQNRFCVTVTQLGTEEWGAQFRLNGLTYVSGENYDVSLTAWSSTAMEVGMAAVDESTDFVWIFGNTLSIDAPLEGAGQDFNYSFTAEAGATDGKFRFLLGAGIVPVNETICFDNISIDGPEVEAVEDTTARVRINQIGYLPNSPKKAVYKVSDDASDFYTQRSWSLMLDGVTVASGETTAHGNGVDSASGDLVHSIDFSTYQNEGDGYTLVVTDGSDTYSSDPFAINSNIYSQVKYDALAYFYHNRSGIEIDADVVGEAWSRPAGHESDSNVETLSCKDDSNLADCTNVDSSKGWYDAGDHGKYVVNGGFSAWVMLNQFERFQYLGSGTNDFNDGTMALPSDETANGIPDILDEAAWQVEWLLNMQVAEGHTFAGMAYHKIHDENWTGFPLAPHEDTQTRYVHDPSTAATLNLAAVGAQCYRIYKDYDTVLAEKCLSQAKIAYQAALQNPAMFASSDASSGGGPYDDENVSDEFYWAAVELYLATGDSTYADDMKASAWHQATPSNMSWQMTYPLGVISLATVGALTDVTIEQDLVTAAKSALISLADGFVQNADSEGYGLPFSADEYPWGSNSSVVNNMMVLGLAYDFTAEDYYINAMLQGANYLFGHNAMSYSYVTGYGTTHLLYPHHRFWAEVLDPDYPPAPAGALSGGPNSSLQDAYASAKLFGCLPQKCFVDNIEAWSVNEITINWNSPFAWVTAYLDEYAEEGSEDGTGEGSEDGTGEGSEDGTEEGSEDGTEEGSEDGTEEGSEDGSEDGTEEGSEDGTEEGSEDGTEEGSEDGTEEGSEDGTEEGSEEGSEDNSGGSSGGSSEGGVEEGSEDGTEEGSEDGTEEGSEGETGDGSGESTEDGTEDGSEETVEDGTEDGSEETVEDGTDDVTEEEEEEENSASSGAQSGSLSFFGLMGLLLIAMRRRFTQAKCKTMNDCLKL